MGRSEPTFRLLLDRLEGEWAEYRRGLAADDARAFDAIFRRARAHASAASNAARVDAMESVFMSVLIEHEREIRALKGTIAELRSEAASPRVEP